MFNPHLAIRPYSNQAKRGIIRLIRRRHFPGAIRLFTQVSVIQILSTNHNTRMFNSTRRQLLLTTTTLRILLNNRNDTIRFGMRFTLRRQNLPLHVISSVLARAIRRLIKDARFSLQHTNRVVITTSTHNRLANKTTATVTRTMRRGHIAKRILIRRVTLQVRRFTRTRQQTMNIEKQRVHRSANAISTLPRRKIIQRLNNIIPQSLLHRRPIGTNSPHSLQPKTNMTRAIQ